MLSTCVHASGYVCAGGCVVGCVGACVRRCVE